MKIRLKAVLLLLSAIVAFSSVAACEKEGGAEKAGKKIDQAFHTAKEKINDVAKESVILTGDGKGRVMFFPLFSFLPVCAENI